MLAFALLPALLLATAVNAQQWGEIEACAQSVRVQSLPLSGVLTYQTTDTSFFDMEWSYDPAVCTTDVRVNRMSLADEIEGRLYSCRLQQFDGTGRLYTRCDLPASPMTKGRMAILSARDGHDEWSFALSVGQRPYVLTTEAFFSVVGEGPIPTGDMTRKRRSWRESLRKDFDCPIGKSMCPTGIKGRFECLSTSSDVMSCGSCPNAMKVNDCTAIEGVEEVECRAGACHVISCEQGWSVGPRNSECVPDILRSSKTVQW